LNVGNFGQATLNRLYLCKKDDCEPDEFAIFLEEIAGFDEDEAVDWLKNEVDNNVMPNSMIPNLRFSIDRSIDGYSDESDRLN